MVNVPDETLLTEISNSGTFDRIKAFFKSDNKSEFITALRQYIKQSYDMGTDTV